jgi:DNA-binding transcriptional LysR family regulator
MSWSADDLRTFLATAEYGSVGGAARALSRAQPSVSVRLAQLERELGVVLFDRTPRGSALTDAGRALVPYASRTLALMEDGRRSAQAAGASERLHIVVHAGFAPLAVPRVIRAVVGLPLRVSVQDRHSEDVVQELADGIADVGFVVPMPLPESLRRYHVVDDPVVCVVAPDHPLRRRRALTVETLARHRVAVHAWGIGAHALLDELARSEPARTNVRLISPPETVRVLAASAGHIGVLARSAVVDDLGRGALVELAVRDLPAWSVTWWMVLRRRDIRRPAMRALIAVRRPWQ